MARSTPSLDRLSAAPKPQRSTMRAALYSAPDAAERLAAPADRFEVPDAAAPSPAATRPRRRVVRVVTLPLRAGLAVGRVATSPARAVWRTVRR